MKVLKKNIFIGTKKICVEYTSKLNGPSNFKSELLERNIIFVKDKQGYYVDIRDTEGMTFLALTMYGAAKRLKTIPKKVGDEYIDDIKPYYSERDQDKEADMKTLINTAKMISETNNDTLLLN